jgi:hypothetical protein
VAPILFGVITAEFIPGIIAGLFFERTGTHRGLVASVFLGEPMKFNCTHAEAILPKTVHMLYDRDDIFEEALNLKNPDVHEIICTDKPGSKSEFIAVYRLVRVKRRVRGPRIKK